MTLDTRRQSEVRQSPCGSAMNTAQLPDIWLMVGREPFVAEEV